MVWKYEQRFFPFLVVVFLWAGMSVPFSGVWTAGRWAVLAVGAIVGFALYMRAHILASPPSTWWRCFAVLAALVSAAVSSFTELSFMKALSLLLLFLYASTGARLALSGREEKFFPRLLFFVEIVVYLSAVAYLVLHMPIYGNPNSLGAIMGVVAVPLLFWGVLTAEGKTRHRRMLVALVLSIGLLFFSQARSGILAAVVSCCRDLRGFAALPVVDSGRRNLCVRGHSLPGVDSCRTNDGHAHSPGRNLAAWICCFIRATRTKACWARASLPGMKRSLSSRSIPGSGVDLVPA